MASASELLLSVVDRIYVINLAHREDRRREIEAELNRIGLGLDHPSVTLFPASFPTDKGDFSSRGARGCFESHLGVHRAILAEGIQRALVLEDDAGLVPDFGRMMADIGPALRQSDWDLFYSVTALEAQPGDEAVGDRLLRLSPDHIFNTSHFMAFSRDFSAAAVPYLQAMASRPPGDPQGGPMHVDGAYCWMRAAHPELIVLGSRDPLAIQRPSRSDIADLPLWDRLPIIRDIAAASRRSPLVRSVAARLRGR